MAGYDKFTETRFIPDSALMQSVSEHRRIHGYVPIYKILVQIVKAKVKTTYPPNWEWAKC